MPIATSISSTAFRARTQAGFAQVLAYAWRVMSTRQGLAELDDRMLKDLGVSRAQAQFEASRPIWKLMR